MVETYAKVKAQTFVLGAMHYLPFYILISSAYDLSWEISNSVVPLAASVGFLIGHILSVVVR